MSRYDIALGRESLTPPSPPPEFPKKKPRKSVTKRSQSSGLDLLANPVIPLQDLSERRFDLIERAQDIPANPREWASEYMAEWTSRYMADLAAPRTEAPLRPMNPLERTFRNRREREDALLPVLSNVQRLMIESIEMFIDYRPDRVYEENLERIRGSMSLVQYRKDFLTYQLKLPRRMGNTTVAAELMRRRNAVYIAVNSNLSNEFVQAHPDMRDRVITASNPSQYIGRRVQLAIVDGASYFGRMHDANIDRVYERMNSEFFVLLG